jgi:hypothetical protein
MSKSCDEGHGMLGPGYATWAYDEVKEGILWKASLEMVGLKDDVLVFTL